MAVACKKSTFSFLPFVSRKCSGTSISDLKLSQTFGFFMLSAGSKSNWEKT